MYKEQLLTAARLIGLVHTQYRLISANYISAHSNNTSVNCWSLINGPFFQVQQYLLAARAVISAGRVALVSMIRPRKAIAAFTSHH